jgi:HAMP domain-containing protein/type II secretory pathway pseudopilin PulG
MLTPDKLRSIARCLSANLSLSADKLHDVEQRSRNWLAASISNRIIFFAISLTMMVVLIIGVISYSATNVLIRQNINASLESQTQLVGQNIQFALNAFVQDVADLAANSLIANGLLDSQGREIYLLPFLRDHKMPVPVEVEITLSDFQGAPIASNKQATTLRSYKDTAIVKQAIETGKPRAEILHDIQGYELLLVQPVVYPVTGRAEGALIARMNLQAVFEKSTSFFTLKFHKHLIIDGVDLTKNIHESSDETLIQVYKHLQLVPPLDSLNLQVMVDQKRGEAFAILNWVTFIYLTLGALTLWLVLRLARVMARRLTLPLSALSQTASQIAASGSLKMKAEVVGIDEVGNLGVVFNEMLNKLHTSHELLELRVAERTQELKHAEQRISSILGSVRDIIRSSALDGKEILYLNDAVEFIFEQPVHAFFQKPAFMEGND